MSNRKQLLAAVRQGDYAHAIGTNVVRRWLRFGWNSTSYRNPNSNSEISSESQMEKTKDTGTTTTTTTTNNGSGGNYLFHQVLLPLYYLLTGKTDSDPKNNKRERERKNEAENDSLDRNQPCEKKQRIERNN